MNLNNNNQYINNNQNTFRCPNCGNMRQGNICRYCISNTKFKLPTKQFSTKLSKYTDESKLIYA